MWTVSAIVTLCLIFQGAAAYATAPKPFYGAPYYDNDAYFSVGPAPTVAQAVQMDWDEYQQYWGVEPYGDLVCSYTFTPSSDGPQTGFFGSLLWTGQCGGGDGIYGTLQCPPGYKLVGLTCVGSTGVTINANPPFIPLGGEVEGEHVLTMSKLDLTVTQDGDPLAGVAVPLQSDRGIEDQIEGGGATDSSGTSSAAVTTWDQPGTSTITSASPDIETFVPGIINWLPARYADPFDVTCYVISLEQDFLTSPMVLAVGLSVEHHEGFLNDVKLQGSGLALNGTYIHYQGNNVFSPKACAVTKSGVCANGDTAAVDLRVVPLGSDISVEGIGDKSADDTGGGILGYHVDLFYGVRRQACLQFGHHPHNVDLLDYGS